MFFPPANVEAAQRLGVKHVALPQSGAKSKRQQKREAQPWFRAARRFRNGIEGRISVLKRARRLDRCLNRGENGVARWIGWGIITNNLVVMAAKLARRHRKRK